VLRTTTTHSSAHHPLRAQPLGASRYFAHFLCRLSHSVRLFRRCCRSLSRFGSGFNRRWQIQLRLFRGAMMAMVQWLDSRSFFFYSFLSDSLFLALVLEICRNRFRCHGQSVAELSPSKLFNFGHSVSKCLHSGKGGLPELNSAVASWRERSNCPHSLLRQSEEMSNFAQPHDGMEITMHPCVTRCPPEQGSTGSHLGQA
jgi:hypothetical protein